MRFDIITIFPRMFDSPFGESIINRAREKGIVDIHLHDLRDHTTDKHRSVDDTPYGGGAGMVMRPEPLVAAVEAMPECGRRLVVLLSPQGEPFVQGTARELALLDQVVLICGRYEGIDERVREIVVDREISVGDFVVSGGELPAMLLVDAVTRLKPGALGNEDSSRKESFEGGLLEHPHYTRPQRFRERSVPSVLLKGNHAQIELWRRQESLKRTASRRPDLVEGAALSEDEKALVEQYGRKD